LTVARILKGDGFLSKRILLESPTLGTVTHIETSNREANTGSSISVLFQAGALMCDADGKIAKVVSFAPSAASPLGGAAVTPERYSDFQVLRGCTPGPAFLVRNNFGVAELISESGQPMWHYSGSGGSAATIEDTVGGDIDGDGTCEFVVATKDHRLLLIDSAMKEKWVITKTIASRVELLRDVGRTTIIHDAGSHLILRDAQGVVIHDGDTGHYLGKFSISRWRSLGVDDFVLNMSQGRIRLFDKLGALRIELDAPYSEYLHDVRATSVKLRAGGPEYLAAVAEYSPYQRSVFYLFDVTGSLLYSEVLTEESSAITTVPISGTDREAVLIGGNGRVIRYEALQ
jgi:hypothetical protein